MPRRGEVWLVDLGLAQKLALRRLGTLSAEELKAIEDGVRHWLAL